MTISPETVPSSLVQRYRLARRWRQCPKCSGMGVDAFDTILLHNFHPRPCSLCDGECMVRYTRRVALGVAMRGRIDHESERGRR